MSAPDPELEKRFAELFAEIAAKIAANPNADGWIRLLELLRKAEQDKRIKSSPGASEFLGLVIELASDSFTASTAEQAIEPLIETSPIAVFAKPFKNNSEKVRKGGPLRVAIAKELKKDQSLKNQALWRILSTKTPKGVEYFDNSLGQYFEWTDKNGALHNTAYSRFSEVCKEERDKLAA